MAATNGKTEPATQRWGYRFGVDGLVKGSVAQEMLGGIKDRTLRKYAQRGLIRTGYRVPGVPSSGVVVCRRSLIEHLARCER